MPCACSSFQHPYPQLIRMHSSWTCYRCVLAARSAYKVQLTRRVLAQSTVELNCGMDILTSNETNYFDFTLYLKSTSVGAFVKNVNINYGIGLNKYFSLLGYSTTWCPILFTNSFDDRNMDYRYVNVMLKRTSTTKPQALSWQIKRPSPRVTHAPCSIHVTVLLGPQAL